MNKEEVIEELMEVDRLWVKKLKKEGPSAYSSPYEKDAIIVTRKNYPNIVGIENIKRVSDTIIHASIFNDVYEGFSEPLSADVSNDFTLGYTTGNYTYKNEINGKIVTDVGKYVLIWKKFDGKWKVSLKIAT